MNRRQGLARLTRVAVAGRGSTAARTPFVLLLVVLLGSGLLVLLLLNASLNQGSFRVSRLQERAKELTEQEQALEQRVASHSDPEALRDRARELGMVPGGPPAFLAPDGTVHGSPAPATALPEPEPSQEETEPVDGAGDSPAEASPSAGTGAPREPQPRVRPEEPADPEQSQHTPQEGR
ncbi:FtsB family cell division protein [Streptomyces sp. TR06-5]|uniref:FtsB family cell division protein n=1 Tax=unclassified Streptomyces TaxID=2593676 RepID=UPI0039A1D531